MEPIATNDTFSHPIGIETGIAVVIPTLNEAGAIAQVVREVPKGLVREIIVADSGSTDGTPEAAKSAGARVVSLREGGYGRACASGAASASADCGVIVFLDGDGSDRADMMAALTAPILAGSHDFVIGSRTRGNREAGAMNWHQLLAGRMAGLVTAALYGVRYSDMCAFRAIRRDALDRLGMRELTYGWNIEMQMQAARAGLRILEVPLPYRRRATGKSKVAGSLSGTIRAAWRIAVTCMRVAMSPRPEPARDPGRS
ncbi:MAG TPA: glycosyltransferase family 2 protein [Alphaproteobacteria bacterium]|nr:glycosyltransferase family 2 protein [Alphaproteobacteria bacterium]